MCSIAHWPPNLKVGRGAAAACMRRYVYWDRKWDKSRYEYCYPVEAEDDLREFYDHIGATVSWR